MITCYTPNDYAQISYHVPVKYRAYYEHIERCSKDEQERVFDNHDSKIVLQRIGAALKYKAAQESNSPEKPDGWISVKDRLPEEDVEVLFFSPKTEFNCCFVGYRPKKDAYVDPEGNGLMPRIIEKYYTHWMPLPEPPKDNG